MTMINAVNEFLDDLRGGRMSEAPVVTTDKGQLQGRIANTPSGKAFYSFQGIPYAKPPLGSLRFKAPQPIEPWDGIRDATSEGNSSAQIDQLVTKQYTGDENCLFLNVYTPSIDGAFLPVMVYIHGGGFKFGSGNTDMFGPDFLVEKDVVVVTINYRLGALGFLSLNTPEVPGNAGIKDIVLALKWVKENIENFGGNAGNLTVFGESAGGAAVSVITASPLTKDLISRAIIQSGTALFDWSFQKKPIDNARELAKILGFEGDSVEEIYDFLNATSSKDIVEAQNKMSADVNNPNPFVLVVEKEFAGVEAVLTEPFINILTSGRVAHVPVMIGSNALEFAFERMSDDLQYFIPEELHIERNSPESLEIAEKIKKLYFKGSHTDVESLHEYYQLLSDKFINVDTHRYVQYLVQSTNVPIFYYKFDYVGELNVSSKILHTLGLKHAMHFDDLGYLFRNDFQKEQSPTPEDIKMRERMVLLWTNFAKSGNPTPEENKYLTVSWLPVTKDNLYRLNLGQELSLETTIDKKMEFWDELYSKHFKVWDHQESVQFVTITSEVVENSVIDHETVETTSEVIDTPDIVDTSPEIVDTTPEIVETTPEIVDTTPEIVETTQETIDITPEIVDTSEVVDNTPEIVETVDSAPVVVETLAIETEKADTNGLDNTAEPEVEPEPTIVQETIKIVQETVTTHEINEIIEETNNTAQEIITAQETESQTNDVQKLVDTFSKNTEKVHLNGNGIEKPKLRTSNEIKMVSNGAPKDVIRANDPPEDDLPKNIGVNKFVNFFESLGGKK